MSSGQEESDPKAYGNPRKDPEQAAPSPFTIHEAAQGRIQTGDVSSSARQRRDATDGVLALTNSHAASRQRPPDGDAGHTDGVRVPDARVWPIVPQAGSHSRRAPVVDVSSALLRHREDGRWSRLLRGQVVFLRKRREGCHDAKYPTTKAAAHTASADHTSAEPEVALPML